MLSAAEYLCSSWHAAGVKTTAEILRSPKNGGLRMTGICNYLSGETAFAGAICDACGGAYLGKGTEGG